MSEEYPFLYQGKSLWSIIGLLFGMTLFFGYFFEPFEVYVPEHKMNYFLICFIHALTPVVVLLFFFFFKLSPVIKDKWIIKNEIILIILFLLVVGVLQFLIRDLIYENPNNWSWNYLLEEIRNTFLVGSLFIFILMPLNFNRLNKKNSNNAIRINLLKNKKDRLKEIKVQNTEVDFEIKDMLFAKAAGNYVELYFKNKKKTLKRITIKKLEFLLNKEKSILKTHRSYLVNLNYIDTVSGNAQGYKLKLNNYSEKIPVSRNMISIFNSRMKEK